MSCYPIYSIKIFLLLFNINEKIHSIQMNLININTQTPYYVENNGSSKIMTPQIARLRNDTYSLSILIDLDITLKIKEDDTIMESTYNNT